MTRLVGSDYWSKPPEEDIMPIWVINSRVSQMPTVLSPKGAVGQMQCVQENMRDEMRRCAAKNAQTLWPVYRLNVVPAVMMISRKDPFARNGDYVRESQHAGVYCEFYTNRRGRYMRLNDAHRHVVYQLNRAAFDVLPLGFPDPKPDLDLGWLVEG